ncbi:MAG: type II toxin-antitoxin system HicA family toxin [Selenomonas sp.]|nr:type II toxin-antitoxin system HicA family toxin [Selenomonas sp.]
MNNKHIQTYRAIYSEPIKSNIKWTDIESMFIAIGAIITEGNGSRVRILLNGERAVFHRPHPENTTDKGAVKSVRRFLQNAGVKIDEL